jgi:hypothetical protein
MLPGNKERHISRSKEEIAGQKICIFVLSLPNLIGQSRKKDWIIRTRDCVAITLKCQFVILDEVKNLMKSMCYKTEILRLEPQNDIVTQSLSRIMTSIGTEFVINNYD